MKSFDKKRFHKIQQDLTKFDAILCESTRFNEKLRESTEKEIGHTYAEADLQHEKFMVNKRKEETQVKGVFECLLEYFVKRFSFIKLC